MNPMDPKVLRTHTRRPRNIKRRFSRQLVAVGAYRKRPAGGCAGAGTHLCRAAGRERTSIGLAPSPCRRSTRGAAPRVPWPRFSWIYTYAEPGWNVPRKAGKRAASALRLRFMGRGGLAELLARFSGAKHVVYPSTLVLRSVAS